jgi:NitT/TauT family transport system substrate-binding protein
MQIIRDRRSFLTGLSAIGAAGLLRPGDLLAATDPPPETTSVRLPRWIGGNYCWAAAYIAGELLRAEGFTDVQYIQGDPKSISRCGWPAARRISA